MTKQETKDHYLRLPYSRKVREEYDCGERYFVAYIEELPGVEVDGETPWAAHYHLQQAFEDYLDAMIEWGEEIPGPDPWRADDSDDKERFRSANELQDRILKASEQDEGEYDERDESPKLELAQEPEPA